VLRSRPVTPTSRAHQHYEIAWVLGSYSLFGFGAEPDSLGVVEKQMREAEVALTAGGASRPTTVSLCNLAWENLYARTGAVAYMAASLATPPAFRESLFGLIALWQKSIFCREPARFRLQFGTLRASLPRQEDSQWVVSRGGTASLIKLLAWEGAASPGQVIDMFVNVLSCSGGDSFDDLDGFTPKSNVRGDGARLLDTKALGTLLERFARDGSPQWDPKIGESLAESTGLPPSAAALLWAGNTDASNSLKVVARADVRKALSLKVKDVDAAAPAILLLHASRRPPDLAWWYNITGSPMPRQALYDIYQQAAPDDPTRLWEPLEGGDDSVVARLSRAYLRVVEPPG
jgi:hypothetical protein